jgi:hypothetical protein
MSWPALNYVIELTRAPNGDRLTGSEKLLLMHVAYHRNQVADGAWPSQLTLARECLCSRRWIQELLKSCVQKGVLAARQGGVRGRGDLTVYWFPALREAGSDSPSAGRAKWSP